MKFALATLAFAFSASAMAAQSLVCHEITKKGDLKSNGRTISVVLDYKANGGVKEKTSSIRLNGFKDTGALGLLSVRSYNLSAASSAREYTTIFFDDNHGMLDVQLQFDSRVIGQSFNGRKATFVIGSDDANPETGFAFGFDVACSSRLK